MQTRPWRTASWGTTIPTTGAFPRSVVQLNNSSEDPGFLNAPNSYDLRTDSTARDLAANGPPGGLVPETFGAVRGCATGRSIWGRTRCSSEPG